MPQSQIRIKLTLPLDLHTEVLALPPNIRSRAVSTVLIAAADGIDLPGVIAATEQLRRIGVLLNQAVHYAHLGKGLDVTRLKDCLSFIERLRGRSRL